MIAKITSGSNVKKIVDKLFSSENSKLIFTNSIILDTQKCITRTLLDRNKTNEGRVKNPNIYISLNFHKDDRDKMDSEPLFKEAIAEHYMDKMGYEDQPYAVFERMEKESPQIHIISTRINDEGKKIIDGWEVFKSMGITEELELEYGLTIAKEHGKKYVKYEEKDLPQIVKNHIEKGEKPLTKILENCIDYAMKKMPTNEEDYRKELEKYGASFRKGDYGYLYFLVGHDSKVLSSKQICHKIKSEKELKKRFDQNEKRAKSGEGRGMDSFLSRKSRKIKESLEIIKSLNYNNMNVSDEEIYATKCMLSNLNYKCNEILKIIDEIKKERK